VDKKISALDPASLPLAGTEVLPIVQLGVTVKVASNDLTVKNIRSSLTSGLLQIAGPAAASTRTMTVPNADFTVLATSDIGTAVPSPTGTGASGTWGISVTGNAATATNGVVTTGSYADPTWITSLAGSKISGNISGNAANVTGTVAVGNGGTGQTSYTDGQLLIGNTTGNTLTKATLTAGAGISVTNGSGSITIASSGQISGGAPVTATSDYTVAANVSYIINNKTGSTQTVTLPSAATNSGRVLNFQNYQAQTVVSNASNVVPLGGGSAGTAILPAIAGSWASLVSDGTNWIMMTYSSNNSLLLE
jgi:hypothetical protein